MNLVPPEFPRVFEDTVPRPVRGRHAFAPPAAAPAQMLTFPDPDGHTLSIRAKAVVFNDPRALEVYNQIERLAPTDANILVIGETGTGKELVARHIHAQSGRKGPFVAVNCGAFNENLIESELFGHEQGAFTGATQARPGWFEAANEGTLFLDEIGDLPLSMQVKLLRVLQERVVVRLGTRRSIPVDVRLVAATNVDLSQATRAGHFRTDLFYRLNVASLQLPPLRERRGDIGPLAEHFIERYRRKLGRKETHLSPDALDALLDYDWPGNIRELENVVHYAVIVSADGLIQARDLRIVGKPGRAGAPHDHDGAGAYAGGLRGALGLMLDADAPKLFESVVHELLDTALSRCANNQVHTARKLGISRHVLRNLMKHHGFL